MKNSTKLMLAAIAACAICGVPLLVPLIVGFAGGGALVAGQWAIGGALVVGATFFIARRSNKISGCTPKSQNTQGCCGEE